MIEKATGITSVNSLAYVSSAFSTLNRGGSFVSLNNGRAPDQRFGLQLESQLDVGDEYGWYQGPAYQPSPSNTIAQVLFTSGTEGEAKAVAISHAALADTTQRLIEHMEIDASIREYIGVPVNYSFGFGRCRAVSSAGGNFYLPQHGFNPIEIQEMLSNGDINAISAVPSLWRLILEAPDSMADVGKQVRWIEIGSQFMSADEKRQLRSIFPNARILQHYGLSEASRSTFLRIDQATPEQLESVGRAQGGVEVRIGATGAIEIRGPHLASGFLREGKLVGLPGENGWLRTSDKGHIQDGLLHFDGRLDDIINCGGIKLSPDKLERAISDALAVGSIAVFRHPHNDLGEQPAVAVPKDCVTSDSDLQKAMRVQLMLQGLRPNGKTPIYRLDTLPITHTGKIQRSKLVTLTSHQPTTEKNIPQDAASPASNSETPEIHADRLIAIWEDILQVKPVSPEDSFFDLGGDSLSAIRVVMRMEKAGVPKAACRRIFEGHSIAQIIASFSATQQDSHSAGEVSSNSDDAHELTDALVSIWQDILKIEGIKPDDSFFDLGGDSLSAIRVAMRMEKAGVPKTICRQIFEGLSIAQIVERVHPDSKTIQRPQQTQGTLGNATAESLVAIWSEILGIDDVSIDDSFFDLGGDSLSAIRVTMRMQSTGLPKETCRKIFEGFTIRQIIALGENPQTTSTTPAGKAKGSAAAQLPPGDQRTPMASASLALNTMRGLLVLLNIAAHWMPGVIARLPAAAGEWNRYLAPLYSSGTPGFAMIFGAGMGFFLLPRFQKNRSSVDRLSVRNLLLLFVGMSLLAAVYVADTLVTHGQVTGINVVNSYYSVIFYYFFAVLTIPLWLRLLSIFRSFSFACLCAAALLYLVHLTIAALQIPPSDNALGQMAVLLMTAKYNYFEMTAGVLLGAAAGGWLKETIERNASLSGFTLTGILLVVLAVIISIETNETHLWTVWPKGMYAWTWPLYLGLILIGTTMLYHVLRGSDQAMHPVATVSIRVISIVGILAFPLFIGHELVRPTAELIGHLGIPGGLAIMLTGYFTLSLYFGYRLYTVYFGGQQVRPEQSLLQPQVAG